jgi:hypothetical protein
MGRLFISYVGNKKEEEYTHTHQIAASNVVFLNGPQARRVPIRSLSEAVAIITPKLVGTVSLSESRCA